MTVCPTTLGHLGTPGTVGLSDAYSPSGIATVPTAHGVEKDSVDRTVRGVASTSAIPSRAWKIEKGLGHPGTSSDALTCGARQHHPSG